MKSHEHEANKASQTSWPYQKIRCCTSTYCVHILNIKTIHSNLNCLNIFTKKTDSLNVKLVLNVKLPKVGSNPIVLVPMGVGPNKSMIQGSTSVLNLVLIKLKMLQHTTSIYSLFIYVLLRGLGHESKSKPHFPHNFSKQLFKHPQWMKNEQ